MFARLAVRLAASLALALPAAAQDRPPIRIACIGDSTTAGLGIGEPEKNGYPARLQASYDDEFGPGSREVRNFGVSGSTALPGERSWADARFAAVAEFNPDIAVIALGTNDCKPENLHAEGADFPAAVRGLVARLRALPSAPQVYLCQPVPITRTMNSGAAAITAAVMDAEIRPAIDQAARELACPLIDLNAALADQPEKIPDGVHPNASGAAEMAAAVHDALNASLQPAPPGTAERLESLVGIQPQASAHAEVPGATVLDFRLLGFPARIACPAEPAANRPWLWRAYFWGHQPAFENALLAQGWHVCWIDTTDLYGNDDALARWDALYSLTQRLGLSPRPFVFGMSRGGLPGLRWAERHPAKVSGLYLDNAALDIRSWPGGRGTGKGAPAEWAQALACYGLTEAAASAYADGPLDHLAGLAAAQVPVYLLLNLADDIVPPAENGEILAERYQALDGPVTVQRREGLGHHPHGLEDPTPLVEFAQEAVGAPAAAP